MEERNEPEYQARWELIEPEPPRYAGRKDGKSGRDIIDVAAFRRLLKTLERPLAERLGEVDA